MDIHKVNFKKDTKYIYRVEYKRKPNEDYEVITNVEYFYWNALAGQFTVNRETNQNFAKSLYFSNLKAVAGKFKDNIITDVVEVIPFLQKDGEYWIKSKADGIERNNLKFLNYAIAKGFAFRI